MIQIAVLNRDIPYDQLFKLMKDAFREREEQGLNFGAVRANFESFQSALKDKTIIVAKKIGDNQDEEIIGFQKISFQQNFMDCGLVAVSPQYKRQGVGKLLFEKSKELAIANHCDYMTANTATGAKSSVKWHLKNGYRIVGLRSFFSKNYYSYIFRLQLKHHPLWSNGLYCYFRYLLSALKCRLCFHENGDFTMLMRLRIKFSEMLSGK